MTDYCKQLFGKSIRELSIEDLNLYFSEIKEETEILEFKSGKGDFEGVFNNNILRTTSAFLNSSGGVLIWGAPEDKAPEKGKPKVCVGDMVLVKDKKEKDQLINRISSSISYMPTGIKVERLDSEKGYVYIIEVQESNSKPHQVNGQYYIRLDGQSKPAPHYIVDSMFKQIKSPELNGFISIENISKSSGTVVLDISVLIFNFSPFINDKNVFFELSTTLGAFTTSGNHQIKENKNGTLHFGTPWGMKYKLLIHDSDRVSVNNSVSILLIFGGEKSSATMSRYQFKLDQISTGAFDFKKHCIFVNENKTFTDINLVSGFNKEEILSSILNR